MEENSFYFLVGPSPHLVTWNYERSKKSYSTLDKIKPLRLSFVRRIETD